MAIADSGLPTRLLAGGGPGAVYPAVLRTLATPVIGQFDPAFTVVMDEVMSLVRQVLRTHNARCFAVSGQASAGIEALLNTLLEPGDRVHVLGGREFVAEVSDCARRYGGVVVPPEEHAKFIVASLIDEGAATTLPIADISARAHAIGAKLLVDATLGLGAVDLDVDAAGVDACAAGVDYCLGAPSGMTLVTYSQELEAMMLARQAPPPTSYLDLLQLQAYWSPERLNHHTAPTSLIYGLREALRLVLAETLERCIERHRHVGTVLRNGLRGLGLDVRGEPPYAIVRFGPGVDEAKLRCRLLQEHDIHVRRASDDAWRIGLLGPEATLPNARRLILAVGDVLA